MAANERSRKRLEELGSMVAALKDETMSLVVEAHADKRNDILDRAAKAHACIGDAWTAIREAYAAFGVRPS